MIIIVLILLGLSIYLYCDNEKLRKKLEKIQTEKDDSDDTEVEELNYDSEGWDKYDTIMSSQPKFKDFFGREYNTPAYDDSYDTNTEFKLREILLLIWWSRFKNGRKVDSKFPQYFFDKYNLNAEKVTERFLKAGLLTEKDGRYLLSDEAQHLVKFYHALKEINYIRIFPMNLDQDFPNWNDGKLQIDLYQKDIKFQHARIDYFNKLIWLYQNYPKMFSDESIQKSRIEYTEHNVTVAQNDINRDKDRIEALK